MNKHLDKQNITHKIFAIIKSLNKNNSKAMASARQVYDYIKNDCEEYIKDRLTSVINSTHTASDLNMTRADIIQEIMVSIKLATGKDKLAFITELNRLEDNYKNSKQEHVFNVTLVNYASPEYQARQAERQQADRQTENHSSIPIETTQGHNTTPHPRNGDGAVNL